MLKLMKVAMVSGALVVTDRNAARAITLGGLYD